MKKLLNNTILCVLSLTMALASCGTSKNLATGNSAKHHSSAEAYMQKVMKSALTAQCLTAKMRLDLAMGSRDISLGGSLKMKRGEVIQLSLTVPIIGEVGRMEFTPDYVMIVDRINTRFVKTSYDKVDFLRSSNLDYNVLEAVFWNEMFYPGGDIRANLSQFTMASAGNHTLLSLTAAPVLDYAFLTQTAGAYLDRTTITPKDISDKNALTCVYGDFVKCGSGKFPSTIKLSFAGEQQTYTLNLGLSSLSNSSDWKTRTELSAKYKQIDAESIFKNLIP